jgi:hypothetical protein
MPQARRGPRRKPRPHPSSRGNQPAGRALSPPAIRYQRIEIAEDLISLVLSEGQALPAPLREPLRQISVLLEAVVERARWMG